ncbi:MAG: flippase-like domain-containing protein [Longimicrobiales bacterium]|nr:flippase-like domain-containing protein [Longimicrobiales bacterium]
MTEPTTRRPGLLRAGKLFFRLLLTGAVTWFILKAVGFSLEELRAFDPSNLVLDWGLVAISFLVLLLAYLFSAALWGLMVREIGGYEVGFVSSLRVFFTANLGRYLPGKLWQIAGLAYLAKGEGVPPGPATGSAILGQAFSLAGATLVGAGVFLGSGRGASFGGVWAAAFLLVLLLGVTSPGILKAVLSLWFRLAKREIPGGFRLDHAFGVRWMGLYAIGWALQGLAFWILVRGLGFDLTLLEGVPAFPAAYVAGYVALFAPAGAGVREGVLVLVLGPGLGAGAAVVAIVARLWTTLAELLPALVLAGGYLRSAKKGEQEGV